MERRRVGILSLGMLGLAALETLRSRGRRNLDGVRCFTGQKELPAFLTDLDIPVCLLRLTEKSGGMPDAALFSALPRGACLINARRGGHLVEADLLAMLEAGQVSAVILDVAEPELPAPDHTFWLTHESGSHRMSPATSIRVAEARRLLRTSGVIGAASRRTTRSTGQGDMKGH